MIEVLSNGQLNTIQDGGRTGFLDIGVSACGAMDRLAFDIGNALLGNAKNAAAVEIALFPFRVRFQAETDFAVTGADCDISLDGAPLPSYWMRSAKAGQTLSVGLPRRGARAYLLLAGGIDVPEVLGSRSTDQKNGFGGLSGRGLKRGDYLKLLPAPYSPLSSSYDGFGAWINDLNVVPSSADQILEVRVLPAAEFDSFATASLETFFEIPWSLTPDANRMGYRISGPVLELVKRQELLSHGIVPGTVQVPPSGQPIIQLADANTCGGYPKIATVIEADLWRLGQLQVGQKVRFSRVDCDTGIKTLAKQRGLVESIRRNALHVARHSVDL